MIVTLDFETCSEADLKKVGAWAYSEHPSTEVICACWAIDDGPIQSYAMGDLRALARLRDLARMDGVLWEAHNVAFEYSIWHNVCVSQMDLPEIPLADWRDSMAVACYYALPAALDKLSRVLRLDGKDPAGGRLISKYSKLHLKTAQRVIPAEDVEAFARYCAKDVELERKCSEMLGALPEAEEEVFLHDFEVAVKGLRLDLGGIDTARNIVERRSEDLAEEFRALTGYNPGQRDRVLEWFAEQGLVLENLQAETIEDLLEEDEKEGTLEANVRRALRVRMEHSKASTKKLDAMARQRGKDGRARFQTRYHGAVTGRNTGAGFQPLNLNRGFEDVEPEQLVRDVMTGDPKWLDCLYGDAMDAIGKASRHWIMPDEDHRIIAGDFTSIEAVVLACLAGEEWKIEAFANQEPIYERTADKIYQLPLGTVTKKTHPNERQDGKTCELAFGYQGALGAWRKFDSSDRHSDEAVVQFCQAWRREHPSVVQFWHALEDAALNAVWKNKETNYLDIGFEPVDGWLTMILPDGKRLWYWQPQVRMTMPQWHKPEEKEECASGECDCMPRPQLTYHAQKEGRWRRVYTYGGKLTENAVQATSRQILKPCELALKRAGYPVVLSVYDEIVCEVPNSFGSIEEYSEIVAETVASLDWMRGWPVRMDTPWEGGRYRK